MPRRHGHDVCSNDSVKLCQGLNLFSSVSPLLYRHKPKQLPFFERNNEKHVRHTEELVSLTRMFWKKKTSLSFMRTQMLIAVVLSNMNAIFAKVLYENGWSPVALYFSVLIVIVGVLAVHELIAVESGGRWEMSRDDVLGTVLTAFFGGCLAPILFYEGLQTITASESIILTGVLPFFVVCFAVAFLGERFRAREVLGGICIIIGFTVLEWKEIKVFRLSTGTLLLLASSAASAFTIIMHKKLVKHRHLDSVIMVRNVLSLLLVGAWMILFSPQDFALLSKPQNVWIFLALPLVSYLLPFFLYFTALKTLTAMDAGLMEGVGRVFGLVAAGFVLGERFSMDRSVSLAFIILGILFVSVPLTKWRIAPSRLPGIDPLRK